MATHRVFVFQVRLSPHRLVGAFLYAITYKNAIMLNTICKNV